MGNIFVTGTGTGIGKTVVAAILSEGLGADYWKPVQAGNLRDTDTMFVDRVTSSEVQVHRETYSLQKPASPHDAAKKDNIAMKLSDFEVPAASNESGLVIEGAGGLMVPLNDKELVIDLIQSLADEVILVSNNYLGSINHTLLSIDALQSRDIPIKGIVFNGDPYKEGERLILAYSQTPLIGRLYPENSINSSLVQAYARQWNLK